MFFSLSVLQGLMDEPHRYWKYHTPLDALLLDNTSIPFISLFSYKTLTTQAKRALLITGYGQYCQQKSSVNQDVNTNFKGNYYHVTFSKPHITKYAVIKPYR